MHYLTSYKRIKCSHRLSDLFPVSSARLLPLIFLLLVLLKYSTSPIVSPTFQFWPILHSLICPYFTFNNRISFYHNSVKTTKTAAATATAVVVWFLWFLLYFGCSNNTSIMCFGLPLSNVVCVSPTSNVTMMHFVMSYSQHNGDMKIVEL